MRLPGLLRTFDLMTTTDTTMDTESATRAAAVLQPLLRDARCRRGAHRRRCVLRSVPAVLAAPAPGFRGLRPPTPGDRVRLADRSRAARRADRLGFVMEHEESRQGPDPEVARRLWLCTVRDGLIVEAVGYCNGGWDDALGHGTPSKRRCCGPGRPTDEHRPSPDTERRRRPRGRDRVGAEHRRAGRGDRAGTATAGRPPRRAEGHGCVPDAPADQSRRARCRAPRGATGARDVGRGRRLHGLDRDDRQRRLARPDRASSGDVRRALRRRARRHRGGSDQPEWRDRGRRRRLPRDRPVGLRQRLRARRLAVRRLRRAGRRWGGRPAQAAHRALLARRGRHRGHVARLRPARDGQPPLPRRRRHRGSGAHPSPTGRGTLHRRAHRAHPAAVPAARA